MDRAEYMAAMAKGYGVGRPVGSHRVKGKQDLAAVLRPAAMLDCVVFADVQGSENRRAVRSQIEGEDASRRIRRRRMALISTRGISLRATGKFDGVKGRRGFRRVLRLDALAGRPDLVGSRRSPPGRGAGGHGRNEPEDHHQGPRNQGTDVEYCAHDE